MGQAQGKPDQFTSSRPHPIRSDARFEFVDAMHLNQAERPKLVAARIRELLPATWTSPRRP